MDRPEPTEEQVAACMGEAAHIRDLVDRLGPDNAEHAIASILATRDTTIEAMRTAIQRVREDTGWCPVCDRHHSEPTEECP